MRLRRAFWLDLEWWSDHLEDRNCVPLSPPVRAEAYITGTDASDWGTGQVVWLDGQREETCLRFGRAEKRRPINWRELLGIYLVALHHGDRLRKSTVLVETDNMAAKGAADKLASTAASMQEVLRRLCEVCERHDITLRLTHTPGEKLFRPDQTSRGDAVIEPRVRLVAKEFATLEARFGPFTEFVGAERRHAYSAGTEPAKAHTGARLWVYPAHETVGSALRLLGERLSDGDECRGLLPGSASDNVSHAVPGPPVRRVVVVPHDPGVQWWKLTRRFRVIGR